MSNRIFQSVMQRTRETVGRTVGVIDENGIVVACSEHSQIGESRDGVREELEYSGAIAVIGGYTYRYIGENGTDNEFAVFVEGTDDRAEKHQRNRSSARNSFGRRCHDRSGCRQRCKVVQ